MIENLLYMYTIDEVADRLGKSNQTVRNWIKTKKLNAVYYPEKRPAYYISPESLEEFKKTYGDKEKLNRRIHLKKTEEEDVLNDIRTSAECWTAANEELVKLSKEAAVQAKEKYKDYNLPEDSMDMVVTSACAAVSCSKKGIALNDIKKKCEKSIVEALNRAGINASRLAMILRGVM